MLNQSSQMGPRRKGKSSSSMRAGVIPLSPVALVILCAFTFLLGWNSVVLVHLVEQQHSVSANSPGTTSSSSNQASLFPAANANLLADHQLGHASSPLLRGGKIVDPSSVSSFNHSSLTLLPPSIWATRKLLGDFDSAEVSALLSPNETERALSLCGKFMYSSLDRAIYLKDMGHDAFVATGDIDAMWTRDSVVQMSIYLKHISSRPWLRFIVEGAIRRNAFNIIQDPYANAYEHKWKDPSKLDFKDQVIGRGGFVSTRNYELDSGAYFLTHLYDYQFSASIYRPEALLGETMVFEAVETLVNLWILEQNHDKLSPYRYFELPNEGQGSPTGYTGMTWTGFRPSDDACKYGYLIPANIHAAGALQRVLILNDRIWRSDDLARKVSKLLSDIEEGINKYGIVKGKSGEPIYAYEVDGLGHSLTMFDDSNVPSLLSIPLLGWDGYNREAYLNTRNYLLSKANTYYFEGSVFKGIGSPHTPAKYIWPMSMVVQGLTEEGPDRAKDVAFQMRQLIKSASNDAMHESVHQDSPTTYTRVWFEWANALFVIYVEAVLGADCAATADQMHLSNSMEKARKSTGQKPPHFYNNRAHNSPWNKLYWQNVEANVHFD